MEKNDDPGLDEPLRDQAASGSERPTELYVDGAYVSAARLHEAKDQGWELIGPVQSSASRSGLRGAYRIEAFAIDCRLVIRDSCWVNMLAKIPAG